jgi:hypothetical protein
MAYVASWQNISAKVREVVGRITFAGLTLVLLAAHADSEARAAGVSFSDFPFLIACEAAGGAQQAYYLSRIDREGVATYQTHAGPAGTITLTGKAQQVGGDIPSSCAGKTLEQLRSAGQAYYLQR